MAERTKRNKIRTVFGEHFWYAVRWTYSIFIGLYRMYNNNKKEGCDLLVARLIKYLKEDIADDQRKFAWISWIS
ncbi:MAG: hypothetical protein CL696_03685 [Chloroflexi bacterium]|nr:hypothetical protein [Chloroflexota bacterium]